MKKNLIYLLLAILSACCIYQRIEYKRKVQGIIESKDKLIVSLKESTRLENLCKGETVRNVRLSDYESNQEYLYDIISRKTGEYYLVVITSLKSCSTCREQALKVWNEMFLKNKDYPIMLIVAEDEKITRDDKRKAKASLRGLRVELPVYFDDEAELLDSLWVTEYETPISVILGKNNKIIAVDKASQDTKKRTMDFKSFFVKLNTVSE